MLNTTQTNQFIKLLRNFTLTSSSLWLAVLLIVTSCNKKQYEVTGVYKSQDPGFIKKAYLYVTNGIYFKGINYKINSDSTYEEINCGNTIKGSWFFKNDSIFLKPSSNIFNNDSLKIHGLNGKQPNIGIGYDTLLFVKNKLKLKDYLFINGKKKLIETILYKME